MSTERARRIVMAVWADDVAIVGEAALDTLIAGSLRFERPRTGDHVDLTPVLEALKAGLELVTACLALYHTLREQGASKAEASKQVEAKLSEPRPGALSPSKSEVQEIVRLIDAG